MLISRELDGQWLMLCQNNTILIKNKKTVMLTKAALVIKNTVKQ